MFKKNSMLLIFILTTQILFAQVKSTDILFESRVFDFGEIDEADGAVEHTYIFTNNSKSDFILNSVKPSCGCTTPEWSGEPVKPGKKGYIKASFNPKGMTGDAFKTIVARGNFIDEFSIILEIKGKITSKRFGAQTYHPGQFGYLVFTDNTFDFGIQSHSRKDTNDIVIRNDGTDSFRILEFKNIPDYLKIWYENKPIAPGESLKVFAEMDGSKLLDWGDVYKDITLLTDDRFYDVKEVQMTVRMADDFSNLSKKALKNAPHISFDKMTIDLGTFKTGGKRSGNFSITNTGKSPLIIHKTYATCSCTILGDVKKQLDPGETITVSVEFDALFKEGKQMKAITFYTNDPTNPESQVVVVAQILEHQ